MAKIWEIQKERTERRYNDQNTNEETDRYNQYLIIKKHTGTFMKKNFTKS